MSRTKIFPVISLFLAVSSCGDPIPPGNGPPAEETPPADGTPSLTVPGAVSIAPPVEAPGEGEEEPPPPPPAEDDAVIVSHTLPTALACGEVFSASVLVRNDGTATWNNDFRLGAVDDSDTMNGPGRIYLDADVTVAPGETHAFVVELTAPAATGTLTTDWRMVHENVRWFGETVVQTVAVTCPVDPLAFHFEDSLRGGSVGLVQGGTFDDDGWHVDAHDNRITFEMLPDLASGSIEFTITGMSNDNLVRADNELFAMYEGGWDMVEPIPYSPQFRNNNYKTLLRVYGATENDRPYATKFMFGICEDGYPGYRDAPCASANAFFEEPFTEQGNNWTGAPERLRIEWGDGHTRYLRNGGVVLDVDWGGEERAFLPDELHFSLGTARGDVLDSAGMPIGAVYSDLVVDGRLMSAP